ncbi:hypothetical protein GUK58_08440 [Acinetobacter pittii]|uniref:hypothetical protein n=1 Tax=Acinetobacter pittii TaxID=48296 RepID=UPI00136BE5F4|nr:hypothetical protein [Acinetobacter pittii]MZY06078.1 hypothetical protein [Acinetobacter pittii]
MINTSKTFEADGYKYIVENSFGIFRLNSIKNSFKGWIVFELISKIKISPYKTEADIDISIHYTDGNEHDGNRRTFTFQGSFLKDSGDNLRASISKSSTTDGHGGIYVEPSKIRGHRVASLAMDHIVQFLKKFPEQTIVNSIKFEPDKNFIAIAKNFYSKFGIPLQGSFLVSDLKTNDNWKERLSEYSIQDIFHLNEYYRQELQFLNKQYEVLCNITHLQSKEIYKTYNIIFGTNELTVPDSAFIFKEVDIENKTKEFTINKDSVISLLEKLGSLEFNINEKKYANKNLLSSIEEYNRILVKRFDIPLLIKKFKLNVYFVVFLIVLIIVIYLKIRTTIG